MLNSSEQHVNNLTKKSINQGKVLGSLFGCILGVEVCIYALIMDQMHPVIALLGGGLTWYILGIKCGEFLESLVSFLGNLFDEKFSQLFHRFIGGVVIGGLYGGIVGIYTAVLFCTVEKLQFWTEVSIEAGDKTAKGLMLYGASGGVIMGGIIGWIIYAPKCSRWLSKHLRIRWMK